MAFDRLLSMMVCFELFLATPSIFDGCQNSRRACRTGLNMILSCAVDVLRCFDRVFLRLGVLSVVLELECSFLPHFSNPFKSLFEARRSFHFSHFRLASSCTLHPLRASISVKIESLNSHKRARRSFQISVVKNVFCRTRVETSFFPW